MAANQDQLDTMSKHECIKSSTALPLFYSRQDKKDLRARDYLDRFEKAARIGKWTTDEQKIDEFTNPLCDDAHKWYKGLKDFPFLDLTKWDTIKSVFLKDYKKKFTAKTICANFRNLQQKPQETVHDYWAKVIFCKMYQAAADKMGNITMQMTREWQD